MIPNMSNKYLSQYHETTLKLKKSAKNERKKLETFFECILQYVLTFNMWECNCGHSFFDFQNDNRALLMVIYLTLLYLKKNSKMKTVDETK